jgi:hypothetical protein
MAGSPAAKLFIVGSIPNMIVVHEAERHGIAIVLRRHAREGNPVTEFGEGRANHKIPDGGSDGAQPLRGNCTNQRIFMA